LYKRLSKAAVRECIRSLAHGVGNLPQEGKMKKNASGSIVFFLGFVLIFGGCASTKRIPTESIPWNFQDTSPTILEGEWKGGDDSRYLYQFKGNEYNEDFTMIGYRTPLAKGFFRILDGNLELLTTAANTNTDDSTALLMGEPEWIYREAETQAIPDFIYSVDIQGDTLILKTIGGNAVGKGDIGETVKFNRVVDN
jgi:hypothetical protein